MYATAEAASLNPETPEAFFLEYLRVTQPHLNRELNLLQCATMISFQDDHSTLAKITRERQWFYMKMDF